MRRRIFWTVVALVNVYAIVQVSLIVLAQKGYFNG